MRKVIFFCILMFLSSFSLTTKAILSEPLWLDMYKKIDRWLYDLEVKYLQKEFRWDSTPEENIKKELQLWDIEWNFKWCYNLEMTIEEIEEIASKWERSNEIAFDKLKWCQKDSSISALTLSEFQNIVSKYYFEKVKTSQNKVKWIYEISSIWLYSDWIDENSHFDLMNDLKEIDKIIFESEIRYDWVNVWNDESLLDAIIDWESYDVAYWNTKYSSNLSWETWWNTNSWNSNSSNSQIKSLTKVDGSNFVCKVDNSWLSSEWLEELLWTWSLSLTSSWKLEGEGSDYYWIDPSDYEDATDYLARVWSYSKVDDSSEFPCNDFFCITIEFVTYSHKVLWFWKWRTIEWFINQSNKHLKKFAWTSLVQSKMTSNFFELWLKDLNLADTFHIWLQVSQKPISILNMDKVANQDKDEDNSEFSAKNLFETYYKNVWLDYQRPNDLDIFTYTEEEYKNLLSSTNLNILKIVEVENELNRIKSTQSMQNDYISNTLINKKVLNDDLSEFYNRLIELESFSKSIMDYSMNLSWIIKEMNKIPNK